MKLQTLVRLLVIRAMRSNRLDALNYVFALIRNDSVATRAASAHYTAEQLGNSLAINQVQLFMIMAEHCRDNGCDCIEEALTQYRDLLLCTPDDDPGAADPGAGKSSRSPAQLGREPCRR